MVKIIKKLNNRVNLNLKRSKIIFLLLLFLIQIISLTYFLGNYIDLNKNEDNDDDFIKKKINTSIGHPNNAFHFRYYKNITINHDKVNGTGNHSNFPVLISILDEDLHSYTQVDGDDIAFSVGSTWLDHEIEMYNRDYSSTQAQLIAWVRIPVLSVTTDTVFSMYYGNETMDSRQNPVGVWDSNYYAVYHMNQDPSVSSVLDSTANNYDLNSGPGFTSGDSVNGIFGKAIKFNRQSDEYLNISSGFSNPTSSLSLELWFKPQQLNAFQRYFTAISGYYSEDICFRDVNILRTRIKNYTGYESRVECTFTQWDLNQFYHFIMTWEGGSVGRNIHYLNGTLNRNVTDANALGLVSPWSGFFIGTDIDCTDPSNVIIEEFRITSSVRSPGWFETEYNNQYDPDSFYSIGPDEEVNPPKPEYFNFFKVITIKHENVSGTSDLIDFPLLVSLEDPDLKDQVQFDGDDIVFANGTDFSNGAIWLDHEIELFDQNYNPYYGKLVAWVHIPILYHNKDTNIYMYYGNSTIRSREDPLSVWDSHYKGVWHLSESSGGTDAIKDSTLNANHGTDYGSPSFGSAGKIDGVIDFKGDTEDEYIELVDSASIRDITEGNYFTYEAWFNPDQVPPGIPLDDNNRRYGIMIKKDPHHGLYYEHDQYFAMEHWLAGPTQKYVSSGTYTPTSYYHIVGVVSNLDGYMRLYVNGNLEDETTWTGGTTPQDYSNKRLRFGIGNPGALVYRWPADGKIDEIRISDSIRSIDWIKTEYNNLNDPNSFYSVSSRHHVSRPKPEDFQYQKAIIINHTKVSGSNNLISFPVLISGYDKDLHNDVQPDGDDIAFWNGTAWLDHEIELFDQNSNGTHAQLVVWICIPKLFHDKDTIIYMLYGNSTLCSQENPSGVWDSTYVGVWHLLESNGDAIDSTIYGEHGIVSGAVNQGFAGKINSAYNFGTDGTVNVGDPSNGHLDFDGNTDFSISFWLNIDTTTSAKQRPLYKGGSSLSDGGYSFETSTSGDSVSFYICDETNRVGSYSAPITYDQWTYITGVVDRTNDYLYIYKDNSIITGGISISSVAGSLRNDIELQFPWASSDLDGLMDEVRISNICRSADWITTEYNSQFNPESFFSIGPETKVGIVSAEVHVVDLYGNFIPNLNITMINNSIIYGNAIANDAGIATFENITTLYYNFLVEMTSDIGNHSVIVNKTTRPILVDDLVEIIYLVCNVSTNFFDIRDIDGIPIDSGWIIVGNGSYNLQNCTIEETGHSRFWWVNSTPYNYNYTVYYRDVNYKPSTVSVAYGNITTVNSTVFVTTRLTTVNFTVITEDYEPIGGAKLVLNYTHTLENVINLTTDVDGKTTFRWLNTTNSYNYSLKIIFLGKRWDYSILSVTPGYISEFDLTISSSITYNVTVQITQSEIEEYEITLVSLNPTTTVSIEWSSNLIIRTLFNVTYVPSGSSIPLGPTSADSISYKIYLFGSNTLIKSDSMHSVNGYKGTYSSTINTEDLECELYSIKISAFKSGYIIPQDLIITLNVLKNDLILNESKNDDSAQNIYWLEYINMSVKPYGKITESFTLQDSTLECNNQAFNVTLHNISNSWNLSIVTFNMQDISWNVNESDIYVKITDPYFNNWIFNISNFTYYDYDKGECVVTLELNVSSPTYDNNFNFNISGSFNGPIDIIAENYFIRDKIEVKYSKFNVKDKLTIINEAEGWVIKNITFEISNFYNISSGELIDPILAIDYITTNEGFKYTLDSSEIGKGKLSISNITIYPIDNHFSFFVHSNTDIIFDVVVDVDYIQYFYQNQYLESFNSSITVLNFDNTIETFQIGIIGNDWVEYNTELIISNIFNGINYLTPSEIAMSITINGQSYNIIESLEGEGIVSIGGLDKEIIHTIIIQANEPVNFSILYKTSLSRTISYEITGLVSYTIREAPSISGIVQYYPELGYYLQMIDTSLIDAHSYTVRFTIIKDNYFSAIKDLDLIIMKRLTLLNDTSDFFRGFEQVYAMEAVNFTFFYLDALTYQPINNLQQKTYVWEQYNPEGEVVKIGQGDLINITDSYILDMDTEKLQVGEYLIVITLNKDNYVYKNGMITLTIVERPTLINGSSQLISIQESIYAGEKLNFIFSYTDVLSNTSIINLNNQSYTWKHLDNEGFTINSGQGNLTLNANNLYVLDFNSETRNSGTYELIFILSKENYSSKSGIVLLTINKRIFNFSLSKNFKNNQINVIKGKPVVIEIHLVDLTQNNINLTDAIVQLTIKNELFSFQQLGDGLYRCVFRTKKFDTFFASKTLTGIISISKEDYISEEFSITIVIEMEEMFPGIPTFYLLLGLIMILGSVSSIAAYRVYKYITTPIFVRKVSAMKKAIHREKPISESLLYRSKEIFIGERVKNKWEKIGLSLAEILGIKIEKDKLKRRISEEIKSRDLTPSGLLLMRWDERIGTEILVKYPDELNVSDKSLMQIYGTHEYSGEKGMVTLTTGTSNILSYYTGPEQSFYLLLFLDIDDDPDIYEGGMAQIISVILENLEDDSYLQMIPSLFQRLSLYPSLSDEEILVMNYQDEIKRYIIDALRDEGLIIKSQLIIWLKDQDFERFVDLEAVLLELVKKDIIKEISIKGMPSELIALINDLFMLRIPPVKLFENPVEHGLPTQFVKTYQSEVKKFFQNYHPTEDDNLKIAEILFNPQVYEILRLLRTAIVTTQDLEKLRKKGVDDIYGGLKLLWDNQLVKTFKDQNNIEYFALLSDFYIDLIFPKYILKIIKKSYEQKTKSNEVLIGYLNILEETYFDLKKQAKLKE